MYAIIEIGSRQYKVAEQDELLIETAVSARTHKLSFDKVLLAVKGKDAKIGNPYLKGAKVNCEVIAHLKGKKKIAFWINFIRNDRPETIENIEVCA